MRRPARPAHLHTRASAAAVAALLALAGCGGGELQDADAPGDTYMVDVVRVDFPKRQRLAQASAFVMTVRNAGDATIPNLAVTLRGFSAGQAGNREADPGRSLWIIDEQPPVTATADTWTAGPLQPDEQRTLRWRVTPAVSGEHTLSYAVAPGLQGRGRAQRAGRGAGAPRGSLVVKVDAKPAFARVDPRTGRVIRKADSRSRPQLRSEASVLARAATRRRGTRALR